MARDKNHNLFRRGDVWYLQKKINKEMIRKALSTSLTEARRLRDQYLKEIELYGGIQEPQPVAPADEARPLFGQLAQDWIAVKEREIKPTTLKDYRSAMNFYILPKFGNVPIKEIGFIAIKKFISTLKCSGKRVNNVLVPLRSLFKFAVLGGIIDKNPMDLVGSLKVEKADIHPLSMDEVGQFLDHVREEYRDFFIVAFFTGMRFGEMAALKWANVDFTLGVIKVRETLVMGEEGRPKTKSSVRDIKMLPPVVEALRDQRKATMGKSNYVFLNKFDRPLNAHSVNLHVWRPALKAAQIKYRTLYQTRHTFATLMLDAGELPGWVQRMMGHQTLQMIHEKYYSFVKNYKRDDGSAFMANVYSPHLASAEVQEVPDESSEKSTPKVPQDESEDLACQAKPPVLLNKYTG
ncbi:MAG: tyrosine-type recombinase/integrase [Deltaproteobacteria bacterium]|nr:tyrosine-type recombinase/integrase [Deltaproteobacteria bacterium]